MAEVIEIAKVRTARIVEDQATYHVFKTAGLQESEPGSVREAGEFLLAWGDDALRFIKRLMEELPPAERTTARILDMQELARRLDREEEDFDNAVRIAAGLTPPSWIA